jgi:CheY-like chemotaxis protein
VADDNPANLEEAAACLAHWCITPARAENGAEAVALAVAEVFDLILMDLQMPVLDGIAATRVIRRIESERGAARVPVVAYTSCAFTGNEPLLRDSGIDAVLDKPCSPVALHACLLRWCPAAFSDAARHARVPPGSAPHRR